MNLRKNKWIVISLAVLVFIGVKEPAIALQNNTKALLWEISGNGLKESSYLFGTYHLLTGSYLSETPEINIPFKNAKGVVVEMVINSSKLQSMGMMAIMPDKKISDLISPVDYKLVSCVGIGAYSKNIQASRTEINSAIQSYAGVCYCL